MTPAPKAASQRSKAAGADAFTALSAAPAEPGIVTSAVASKRIFFMTIPSIRTVPLFCANGLIYAKGRSIVAAASKHDGSNLPSCDGMEDDYMLSPCPPEPDE